jgi:dCTP deaminase
MILTGHQINREVENGRIIIDPFDPVLLNPNSYNFRLGRQLLTYSNQDVIDTRYEASVNAYEIPDDGFVLEPGKLYLGHTLEKMGSSIFVPILGGRSSTGRLGLFVHITAPLGDIGYFGQWTLQFRATVPVRIYYKQKIGQMIFVQSYGEISPYIGKYQGGTGPQPYNPKGLFAVAKGDNAG